VSEITPRKGLLDPENNKILRRLKMADICTLRIGEVASKRVDWVLLAGMGKNAKKKRKKIGDGQKEQLGVIP